MYSRFSLKVLMKIIIFKMIFFILHIKGIILCMDYIGNIVDAPFYLENIEGELEEEIEIFNSIEKLIKDKEIVNDENEKDFVKDLLVEELKYFYIGIFLGFIIGFLLRLRILSILILSLLTGAFLFFYNFQYKESIHNENDNKSKAITIVLSVTTIPIIFYLLYKILSDRR